MTRSRGLRRKSQSFGCWVTAEQRGYGTACHVWHGHRGDHGYGRHRGQLVHRTAYERAKGPIPQGLSIDHLCRNPECVNPDHLEAVTLAENTRRQLDAITIPVEGRRVRSRSCKRGHDKLGKRTCPVCAKASRRRYADKLERLTGRRTVVGGLGVHSTARIEKQRAERADRAKKVASLYLAGAPTREITERMNLRAKEEIYALLEVAGVKANRAVPGKQDETAGVNRPAQSPAGMDGILSRQGSVSAGDDPNNEKGDAIRR